MTDFSFSHYTVWEGLIHFAGLACLLLLANVLRRKTPFLRRSLLPTAVVAGFIGLLLKELFLENLFGSAQYEQTEFYLRVITYHAIAIGFIALGLKVNAVMKTTQKKGRSIYSGLLIVSSYMVQGFIGLALSLLFAFTIFPNLFEAAGMLVPMGFGQGPGQAQNIGYVYEERGFVGGTSFGLAIASFGFIWASVIGVIYLNVLNRKGRIQREEEGKRSLVSPQEIDSPDEIPVSEAIDKFTVQIALVLVVYFVAYGFIIGIVRLMDTGIFGDFGIETVGPLVLGFNFIIGMLFALLFRKIFLGFRKINLMTRQYPNNFMLNRIAGTVFDFMIVASIAAIRIEDLSTLWIPFFILVIVIGIATFAYVLFLTRRIYPDYPIPAMLGMFGMMTGTASTGIILLREADPNFRTPAANDLVVGSSTAILFGFPILLLVGIAPISTVHTFVTLGIIGVLLAIVYTILIKMNPKQPS